MRKRTKGTVSEKGRMAESDEDYRGEVEGRGNVKE